MKRRGFFQRIFGGKPVDTSMLAVQVVMHEYALPNLRQQLYALVEDPTMSPKGMTPADRKAFLTPAGRGQQLAFAVRIDGDESFGGHRDIGGGEDVPVAIQKGQGIMARLGHLVCPGSCRVADDMGA